MICLNVTDTLEGGASVTNVVDYTVHGLVAGVFTNIAQGQLSDTNPSVLYTAGAAISVVSVTFVNTHSASVTVDLYLDPANDGSPRRMIPKAMTLGVGYSMHFDGQRCSILDSNGGIVTGLNVSDIAYAASWDGITTIAPSKNAVYGQMELMELKTVVGKTNLATGFTITGGTTSKTLTVDETVAMTAKMAVTGANLAIGSDADGDMYTRISGVLARIAKGAANLKMFMNAGATAPEWAAGISIVAFTRLVNGASGNVSYTAAGFKPSAVLCVVTKQDAANMFCIGGAVGTTEFVVDLTPLAAPVWEYNAGALIRLITNTAGTELQYATVTSMDSDGMTLTWTGAGAGAGTLSGFFIFLR